MCCFASGSKGNCCYVSDGKTNILIDLGISALHAEKCLSALSVDPNSVNVFVTHSHTDHVGGLKKFVKSHPSATVHCQRESAAAVYSAVGKKPIVDERDIAIDGLHVYALPVPHDVPCVGYVIDSGGKSVAVVTDVGRISPDVLNGLCGCGIVMLEANHDPTMLRNNPRYTARLKARIASPYGHLSNADCGGACAYLAQSGVKNFILAHLSEENNTPELAVAEVSRAVEETGVEGVKIIAATQHAMTGLFEIC